MTLQVTLNSGDLMIVSRCGPGLIIFIFQAPLDGYAEKDWTPLERQTYLSNWEEGPMFIIGITTHNWSELYEDMSQERVQRRNLQRRNQN